MSWVEDAARYARAVADNKATYGFVRVPGGWTWADKNEEHKHEEKSQPLAEEDRPQGSGDNLQD